MKRTIMTGIFAAIILAVASNAQAVQGINWTWVEPSVGFNQANIEDMVILKKNQPASAADPNDRLAVLLTAVGSTSTSKVAKVRIYDAGTGNILNEQIFYTSLCATVDCEGLSIASVGHINNDRIEDMVIRAKVLFGSGNIVDIVVDTATLTILGSSFAGQSELDAATAGAEQRPKVLFGDFDKDGNLDYIQNAFKGSAFQERIYSYSVQ